MHNEGLNPNDPFSQSLKKSILWNAVEPGDPYDIKKSMIAKLPGDKKIFLGNKLQIVCLLQAAEIERLALNLEQYKVRLREVEKSDLDRHSYEIQIKELASRLQNEESLRSEIGKLKNFIDRLNQELDESRQKLSVGNNQLNLKYQQALLQIQTITDQNAQLANETSNIRRLLQSKSSQYSQAEVTISELRQELSQYSEVEGKMEDYEDNFTVLGKEIERLNVVLKGKTADMQSLEDRLAQSESYLRSKREENEFLISSQLKLSEEINILKAQLRRTRHEEDQQRVKEYESRLQISNHQINSLNIQITNERSQFQSHCDMLKAESDQLRSIIRQLETHIQQLEQQNEKYEDNAAIVRRQIERLNGVLKNKIDDNTTLQTRNNRLTEQAQFHIQQVVVLQKESAELRLIHRRMEDLEFQLSKQQAAKERLAKINSDLVKRQAEMDQSTIEQYEIRINHLNQEIQRFSESVFILQNENKTIKEKVQGSEYAEQQIRKLSRELADVKNLMAQEDISKRNTQERINDLTRKCGEYQKLINELSSEIQRLNEILKSKLQENSVLENKMQYISGQNHRLEAEVRQHAVSEGKIEEYENRFALISLEIERLNNNLKVKLQQTAQLEQKINFLKKENANLKDVINETNYKSSQSIQEVTEQMRRQIFQKDEELNRLRVIDVKFSQLNNQFQKINQILRQKLQEIKEKDGLLYRIQSECESLRIQLREARNKQKQISDLERLNNLLRLKVEEAARWESANHQLIKTNEAIQINLEHSLQQNSNIQGEFHRTKAEISGYLSQIDEYKEKFSQILRQFERLQQMLESFRKDNGQLKRENYDLKSQLSGGNLKEKNHRLLEEIQRLKVIIQQQKEEIKQLRLILSQDHSFQKRIREQLSLIVILCAEIETLRKRVQDKEREVEDVRRESLVPLKA